MNKNENASNKETVSIPREMFCSTCGCPPKTGEILFKRGLSLGIWRAVTGIVFRQPEK